MPKTRFVSLTSLSSIQVCEYYTQFGIEKKHHSYKNCITTPAGMEKHSGQLSRKRKVKFSDVMEKHNDSAYTKKTKKKRDSAASSSRNKEWLSSCVDQNTRNRVSNIPESEDLRDSDSSDAVSDDAQIEKLSVTKKKVTFSEDSHKISKGKQFKEQKRKVVSKMREKSAVQSSEDDFVSIREEVSEMSFEELQKLKDRLGVKVYRQVMQEGKKSQSSERLFKRENKNRPTEISSKKPVSVIRDVMTVKKKVSRDPRFDDLSGQYSEAIFKSSYAFLDDIKQKEKEKLSKQLKKAKNDQKKEQLRHLINKMQQRETAEQMQQRRKDLGKEWKKKEMNRVKGGKNPFFLKKSDARKLELAERFKELKKSGKLEKYMGKKRKKNASKEKRKLPAL